MHPRTISVTQVHHAVNQFWEETLVNVIANAARGKARVLHQAEESARGLQ